MIIVGRLDEREETRYCRRDAGRHCAHRFQSLRHRRPSRRSGARRDRAARACRAGDAAGWAFRSLAWLARDLSHVVLVAVVGPVQEGQERELPQLSMVAGTAIARPRDRLGCENPVPPMLPALPSATNFDICFAEA